MGAREYMGIYEKFQIVIDEKEILRLLGYADRDPGDEMLEAVQQEIAETVRQVAPKVAYERVEIEHIEHDRVFLKNGVILEGNYAAEKLKNCSYIIATIATAGEKMDKIIHESFSTGDYVKGMINDFIGTCIVGYADKTFWNEMIKDIQGTTIGITSRISPGDTKWPISEQVKIFELIDGTSIGVNLSDTFMMTPMKSTSMVYGFGEGIGITRADHVCSECSMQNCNFRSFDKLEVTVLEKEQKKVLQGKKGENLLQLLRKHQVDIQNPCGGNGTCGKCKVRLTEGYTTPTESEKKHLTEAEMTSCVRLACSISLAGALTIEILGNAEKMAVMTAGEEKEVDLKPAVEKRLLKLAPPALEDQREDWKRVREALGTKQPTDLKLLRKLPRVLREKNYEVTAVLYEKELQNIEAGDTTQRLYGAAVDIGTTTIAVYLIDLQTGKMIDVTSEVNKQRAYGADVISRINYTMENREGTEVLHKQITGQLKAMLEALCSRNKLQSEEIYHMTVVGNTTMIHLLLGLTSEHISKAPYIPVLTEEFSIEGEELGLNIGGTVSVIPGVASYVGSDITAGILSCDMDTSEGYVLLLDLGTNGEIALGNKNQILTCSTAAGPAFEGANIRCGIGGVKGAISAVDFTKDPVYETIGGTNPCGICGSGVLDMVAQLIKYEIVDITGRMVDADEVELPEALSRKLIEVEEMKTFLLQEGAADREPIFFTQKDVREVQLAKAAVAAGIKILIKEAGISMEDIEKVCIAGGFGNYMNIQSALEIGLLPKDLSEKIVSIGNAAGTGARLSLLSNCLRERLNGFTSKIQYIELSSREDFQEYFIDGMMFGDEM